MNESSQQASSIDGDYEGYPYYSFVLPFERVHDFEKVRKWFEKNWIVSLYIGAAYLVIVYTLERYMRNKRALDVRRPFMWWNICLSIFSFGGMCRTVPELVYILWNYGYESSVCCNRYNSVTGFWASAAIISKGVELLETGFLVLRKKLTFIHIVHHILTLLATWFFAADKPAIGRWSGSMNLTVHSFMYAYFAIKSTTVRIPEAVAFFITSIQVLQFIFVFMACLFSFYVNIIGHACSTSIDIAIGATFVNGYFLYIFGKYFIHRYFTTKTKSKIN